MSAALIQFNSGDHNFNGQNIAESIATDGDVVFNESYIVVGDTLEAKKLYATYDLTVMGNLSADLIVVNGTLLVNGDIDAETLTCHGKFICTGEVRVKELNVDRFSVADSIVSDTIEKQYSRQTLDFLGGRCSRISGWTPEAQSRICVCRASFLMTFVQSGRPPRLPAHDQWFNQMTCLSQLGFLKKALPRLFPSTWHWRRAAVLSSRAHQVWFMFSWDASCQPSDCPGCFSCL